MLHKRLKWLLFTSFIVIAAMVYQPSKSNAASFVNPNQIYTYEEMVVDIKELANAYPNLVSYHVIGKSEYGRDIYAVSLGNGSATAFVNGSHHAREWLTTNLNMYMIDQYASAYQNRTRIDGYNVRGILDYTTMWFVPMVNPDGVTLQQYGTKKFPQSVRGDLLAMNDFSSDFKRWKANAKGVDLNRQYNADWANIKNDAGKPYYKNYKGTAPNTAAETRAIVNFIDDIDPEMTVAYHSAGQILYWNFHQYGSWYDRDHAYAKKIGSMTGYSLVYPGLNPSGGGLTDWFIIDYKRPAFTPEIGRYPGETSLPVSAFNEAWNRNKTVGLYVAYQSRNLYLNRYSSILSNARNKVDQAISLGKSMRHYYTTDIKTTDDIRVSSAFSNTYNKTKKAIDDAENAIQSLEPSDRNELRASLDEAVELQLRAARFIDAVKVGKEITTQKENVQNFIEREQLIHQTKVEYDALSYDIRKMERVIGKVYGGTYRDLMLDKYIVPAKITKETIIYEISRYDLLNEIDTQIDRKEYDTVEYNLGVLERLERRSIEIKEAGNELYPGRYPTLEGFEETLDSQKQTVLQKYNDALVSDAEMYLGEAETIADEVEPYYTTNIQSTEDIQVSPTFENKYNELKDALKEARTAVERLDDEEYTTRLDRVEDIQLGAAYFIDAYKVGEGLEQIRFELQGYIEQNKYDQEAEDLFNQMTEKIALTERVIERVYGDDKKALFTERYVIPAEETKQQYLDGKSN
ncbi:M14 family zinc carboxypeptidase [Pseudalkalibacillus sp. R45]|uniref:M14 family zinc carboxypeptidase n=1 Tax=Pseudalkalibacillus sp. R45 TaxID=3457433 RepID=UPI003FCCA902